jgi:predicted dehydrogenase
MRFTASQRAEGKARLPKGPGGVSRRGFLKTGVAAGIVSSGSLGAFYFGYDQTLAKPLRVGVLGTGDEGNVLIGAINPDFVQVQAIADPRPYNVHRALHGDYYSEAAWRARPGLLRRYGWKTEDQARRHVNVYRDYRELLASEPDIDAVIIALPLHLHAPAAIAAMQRGKHVLTEKLMAHRVHQCKEMARVSEQTGCILATGHQRHYNLLYQDAVETIQRGALGDLHYIRAQWHRGNLPGKDSWQPPLPPDVKPDDPQAEVLVQRLRSWQRKLDRCTGREIDLWRKRVQQVQAQLADRVEDITQYGYQPVQVTDETGQVVYQGPAEEELIRWRLWDRTGGGLMVELGSHQLDAASIFISAVHGGQKQHPLNVMAVANRPLFGPDRDVEDHICCIYEFPAPGYDPHDEQASRRRIGVQYASINGNGYGGYGETVYGTEGTLILQREQDVMLLKGPSANRVKMVQDDGPTLDTQESGGVQTAAETSATAAVSRGYTEQLEHWAWCVRHPAPENQPRCHPKVALADAVVAHTTNIAAREGRRIDFCPEWFDPQSDETPEGIPPDTARYVT